MASQKCTDDAIIEFIREYVADRGYPPTRREIGEACGIVVSAMNRRLKLLAVQQRIYYEPRIARAVILLE